MSKMKKLEFPQELFVSKEPDVDANGGFFYSADDNEVSLFDEDETKKYIGIYKLQEIVQVVKSVTVEYVR